MADERERPKRSDTRGQQEKSRETEPQDVPSARELRELADQLAIVGGESLTAIADLELPLTTGNLKEFPRPTAENQAAERGVAVLRRSIDDAVATLYALAAAREQGRDISAVLFATVEPYVVALRRK